MTTVLRTSAFGQQAAKYGRALPFSESVASVTDLPEPLSAALQAELADERDSVRLIIHSPAFSTVDQSSPENAFALTDRRWVMAAHTDAGVQTHSAPFAAAAVVELTMILLGGQLRIASVAGAASCAISFNMVSLDLFREALFMVLASARAADASGSQAATSSLDSLSFKFRTALGEQAPPGETVQAVCSWEREVPPLAWLMFRRPAAPAGMLAVTGHSLIIITDPYVSKGKQAKGESPHGKIATYLLRRHPIAMREGAGRGSEREFSFEVGEGASAVRHALRVPTGQAAPVLGLIEAARLSQA